MKCINILLLTSVQVVHHEILPRHCCRLPYFSSQVGGAPNSLAKHFSFRSSLFNSLKFSKLLKTFKCFSAEVTCDVCVAWTGKGNSLKRTVAIRKWLCL